MAVVEAASTVAGYGSDVKRNVEDGGDVKRQKLEDEKNSRVHSINGNLTNVN